MSEKEPNDTSALEHWSFLLFLAVVSFLFVWVAWPFAGPLLWSVLAAIMFQPLYKWAVKKTRGRRNSAALLTLLIIFVAILLPAIWIGSIVVGETLNMVNELSDNPIDLALWFDTLFSMLPATLQHFMADNGWGDFSFLQARLQNILGESAGLIAQQAVSIGSGAFGFVLSFALALYVLFFLLRDGSRIGETILHSAPDRT